MKKIVLASNNKHKIEEFKKLFENYEFMTMADVGFFEDIEENGTTFLDNSLIKAKAVQDFLKKKNIEAFVIADDSGLCVDALDGAPGVYSARYGGNHDSLASRKLLLKNMEGIKDRTAHFECVIVKMDPDCNYIYATGKCFGKIADKAYGDAGFAYDPIFLSDDLNKTFAQVTMEEKNSVSHRARALEDLKRKWKF